MTGFIKKSVLLAQIPTLCMTRNMRRLEWFQLLQPPSIVCTVHDKLSHQNTTDTSYGIVRANAGYPTNDPEANLMLLRRIQMAFLDLKYMDQEKDVPAVEFLKQDLITEDEVQVAYVQHLGKFSFHGMKHDGH